LSGLSGEGFTVSFSSSLAGKSFTEISGYSASLTLFFPLPAASFALIGAEEEETEALRLLLADG